MDAVAADGFADVQVVAGKVAQAGERGVELVEQRLIGTEQNLSLVKAPRSAAAAPNGIPGGNEK